MSGRKLNPVWLYFEKIATPGKAGCRAVRKNCQKEIQGLVSRVRQHHIYCVDETAIVDAELNENGKRHVAPDSAQPKKKAKEMAHFVIKTTAYEKAAIDEQIARLVYATNSPFTFVEHPEFLKLKKMMRPGYTLPTRYAVSDALLNKAHGSLENDCRAELEGQTVSMALDGWSSIHNEPVVCVSVTTTDGKNYLTETVDTSGEKHTAQYLQELAFSAVRSAENRYGIHVASFVTDNASNMVKMRRELAAESGDIIAYGCSAHYLNLLTKDVEIGGVKENIVQIMKYFRNVHLPSSWYRNAGGTMLALSQEVRWNTLADSLKSYLKNWAILVNVCEDHRDDIDSMTAKTECGGLPRADDGNREGTRPHAV